MKYRDLLCLLLVNLIIFSYSINCFAYTACSDFDLPDAQVSLVTKKVDCLPASRFNTIEISYNGNANYGFYIKTYNKSKVKPESYLQEKYKDSKNSVNYWKNFSRENRTNKYIELPFAVSSATNEDIYVYLYVN